MTRFDSILNSNGIYHCPVCRHGQISSLALMDAFACNFCRHIFAANWHESSIQMADSQIPLSWRWNGRKWQGIHPAGIEFGWGYVIASVVFVLLPTTIVGLGAYLFPPLTGDAMSWFPGTWTLLTFIAHLLCILALLVEYYQFPLFLYLRSLGERLINRVSRA
jgi:hypothetical protein